MNAPGRGFPGRNEAKNSLGRLDHVAGIGTENATAVLVDQNHGAVGGRDETQRGHRNTPLMSDRLHREFRPWRALLGLLDIARLPALVDGRFGGPVQAQDREVASSWHGSSQFFSLPAGALWPQKGYSPFVPTSHPAALP